MIDDVTFQRTELVQALPRYMKIRDCVQQTVKDKADAYLPKPNPTDTSAANGERYKAYLERAIFYGVTGRTLKGMVGQVYARDPIIKVPTLLDGVVADATGTGLSLIQLSKDEMHEVMALGRGGIFTDYPKVEGATTRKQQLDGEIRPTMTIYAAEHIINWRYERRGAKMVKSLVVLLELVDVLGTFQMTQMKQYRVLRLVGNVYVQEIWQEGVDAAANPFVKGMQQPKWRAVEVSTPLGADGFPFTEIPFEFIGATNNDATVDEAPLFDIAEVNIGHYRNSADYEEAAFIVGQPTPWLSGLTEEWVEDVLKGEVLLGSRAAIPLPENSQAGLLQVSANSMPMEAMTHKEAQMVALGARLVESRAVRRTASEVKDANAAETSILASCANNVSAAFTAALVWAARFMGASVEGISFALNTDFALAQMPADERNVLIAEMQAGATSFTEVRAALRRAGIVFQDDATAKAEIQKWLDDAAKRTPITAPAVAKKPPQQ